jgi:hypothetical protein
MKGALNSWSDRGGGQISCLAFRRCIQISLMDLYLAFFFADTNSLKLSIYIVGKNNIITIKNQAVNNT